MQTSLKSLLAPVIAVLALVAACGGDPSVASLQMTNLPSATVAGGTQNIIVNALDANGALVPSYAGTVHFTSSNPAVQPPGDYAFVPADSGSHPFAIEFAAVGSLSLTVTDLGTPALTATATTVTAAPALTGMAVAAPMSDGVGSPFDIQVVVDDVWGGPATYYTGTVHFSSTDPLAVLPADYTFTSADAGMHTFPSAGTFLTAGSQSITVTDVADALTANLAGVTVQ